MNGAPIFSRVEIALTHPFRNVRGKDGAPIFVFPQGLKPNKLLRRYGTAEAVPFQSKNSFKASRRHTTSGYSHSMVPGGLDVMS